jgi:hypothetical protein
MHPRFSGLGMGGHHKAVGKTHEWLTPPWLIEALGGWQSFDLDPCAPIEQPYPTARAVYTKRDNGLFLPWHGRVYLNPPYATAEIAKWLARMAAHDCGTALIFARTETNTFHRYVWASAAAVLFLRGRLNFHQPDGTRARANSGAPSVLVAYGMRDADVLAFCGVDGQFVPLCIPRSVIVAALDPTWAEALDRAMPPKGSTIRLDELYRAFAGHPKAKANPNYRAKLRQQLQLGDYRRVGRGEWERAQ